MRQRWRWVVGLLLLSTLAFGQGYVPGEVLVKFRTPANLSRGMAKVRARSAAALPGIGVHRLVLPKGISVPTAVDRLRRDPGVLFAEPNYTFSLDDVDDPLFGAQWNLTKVAAPAAWSLTLGSPAVLVAVLDTGADLAHPDLAGQIAGSKNFVAFGQALDGNGHGTHTAGIVAARTNNGLHVASLGFQTRLLIGKVASDQGVGTVVSVVQGIEWAISSGAKVINMSFTFALPSESLREAIDDAWQSGIVPVAAAGNQASMQPAYPAAYEPCIAVAATDSMDARAAFSNYGPWVDVAAPGDHILSLFKLGGTATMSGTSMAAPHVAALAALLWANGGRSNASVRYAIVSSGKPTTGFGAYPLLRMNARNALLRLP